MRAATKEKRRPRSGEAAPDCDGRDSSMGLPDPPFAALARCFLCLASRDIVVFYHNRMHGVDSSR
jgi:hypothetical protein